MKTFSLGGIHPCDSKLSATMAIEPAPLPARAVVFLGQHIGAPATAVVAKGDSVCVGDLLGDAGGFVSARVHSPVSGTVASIEAVADGAGIKRQAVVINVDGDNWNDAIDRSAELVEDISLSPVDIVKKIAEAGIVGLGGATFPTQVKLAVPAGKTAKILIINGVECEPYLTADHRLMLERPREIIVGCRIVMKALGVTKCAIGIESNKPDAIEALRAVASEGIEIMPLKMQYPQGGEKQLIDAVTGHRVPSGGLPIEVGAVVQNIGTIFAIYEAVQKNKPLFERVVTVTGKLLATPKNLLTRVGTPISELIAYCGGEGEDTAKIINGGPMMGRAMSNPAAPVTKGSSGVLLMPSELAVREKESPCISCSRCVSVCPMGLEPYLLAKIARVRLMERLEEEKVTDCIECGSCSYICPANIPLLDYIRLGKTQTMAIIRSRTAK